jgi:hypothetical protein
MIVIVCTKSVICVRSVFGTFDGGRDGVRSVIKQEDGVCSTRCCRK